MLIALLRAGGGLITAAQSSPDMPDHCILDFRSTPPQMVCLHCQARETLALPLPLTEAVRHTEGWIRAHRRCPRPKRNAQTEGKTEPRHDIQEQQAGR